MPEACRCTVPDFRGDVVSSFGYSWPIAFRYASWGCGRRRPASARQGRCAGSTFRHFLHNQHRSRYPAPLSPWRPDHDAEKCRPGSAARRSQKIFASVDIGSALGEACSRPVAVLSW